MEMSIRKIIIMTIITVVALASAATASAGGRDYTFSAVPQNQFVSSGENATIDWSASNNTSAAASCDVVIQEMGFTVFSGVIQAGTNAGGQVSTPALYKNAKFTFSLACDGSPVSTRAINVKVR
jgi:hypothetical protein